MTSNNEIENIIDEFTLNGISQATSKGDKKIFAKIKKILFEKVTSGGHDYIPLPMEYRASSVAYCGRKTILNKDPKRYLEKEVMEKLPNWYLKTLEEGEIPTKFGTSFAGQVIHEVIQNALKDEILSMEEEVSFEVSKFKLMGHYDLLIEDEVGQKIVVDIKSTQSNRRYLPNKSHLQQLMAYQGMLDGIKGALLYVHRNNWELSFVTQEFNKEKFSQIIMKLSQMALFEEKGELPPPTPAYAEECASESFTCQFYEYCFPAN